MPMIKKSITVTDQQEKWIQAQIAKGGASRICVEMTYPALLSRHDSATVPRGSICVS